MTFGDVVLCISSPGHVTITGVSLDGASGRVAIEAFAVRPNPVARNAMLIGDTSIPLSQIGDGFVVGGAQTIDAVCPTPEDLATSTSAYELAFQMSRSSGRLGGGTGLAIDYESAGQQRTYRVPFGFWLCASPQAAGYSPTDLSVPPHCS